MAFLLVTHRFGNLVELSKIFVILKVHLYKTLLISDKWGKKWQQTLLVKYPPWPRLLWRGTAAVTPAGKTFVFGIGSFLGNAPPSFLFVPLRLHTRRRSEPRPSACSVVCAADLRPTILIPVWQQARGLLTTAKPVQVTEGRPGQALWVLCHMGLQLRLKTPASRNLRSSLLKWTWGFEQHLEASFFHP